MPVRRLRRLPQRLVAEPKHHQQGSALELAIPPAAMLAQLRPQWLSAARLQAQNLPMQHRQRSPIRAAPNPR